MHGGQVAVEGVEESLLLERLEGGASGSAHVAVDVRPHVVRLAALIGGEVVRHVAIELQDGIREEQCHWKSSSWRERSERRTPKRSRRCCGVPRLVGTIATVG